MDVKIFVLFFGWNLMAQSTNGLCTGIFFNNLLTGVAPLHISCFTTKPVFRGLIPTRHDTNPDRFFLRCDLDLSLKFFRDFMTR